MLLSVTDASKAVGCARSTIYDRIKAGELSRNSGGKIDTAELLRVFGELKSDDAGDDKAQLETAATDDTMLDFMREQVTLAQSVADEHKQDAEQLRVDLADTQERLNEHRDNARLLENKSQEWQQELLKRQAEITAARHDASELKEQLQKSDARARALQGRGLFARLLNRAVL